MKIQDSVVIVTGGAQGIGKAIASYLLKHNAKVCIADVDDVQGKETVREFAESYGDCVIFQQCDITKDDDFRTSLKITKDAFGDVTIVVNNAGILDETNISGTIAINLEAQIRCTMIALEFMGRNNGGKGGTIVFNASDLSIKPLGTLPVYAAAKHGVVGFVRSMALSPQINDWGVRFNAVCPTMVETQMTSDDNLRRGVTDPVAKDQLMRYKAQHLQASTILQPSDVVEAVVKLVEDDTLNGASLLVLKNKTFFVDPPVLDLS